ncbi:MAG: hypothetical protein JXB20_02625 [Bacilli bacterium]|nr:hypothetical protein [Bacilli bacterium]
MLKQTLTDNWFFFKGEVDPLAIDRRFFDQVAIPHTWNAFDGQDGGNDYYRGKCAYICSFRCPQDYSRTVLAFEGVNSVAEVYLNNRYVGVHQGGYSAFAFDISSFLVSEDNQLVILVDNSHIEEVIPLDADFTFYGGIYRQVSLYHAHDLAFDRVFSGSKGILIWQRLVDSSKAELDVEIRLVNHSSNKEGTLVANVFDEAKRLVATKEVPFSIQGDELIEFSWSILDPHLWQGRSDPYLYTFEFMLIDGKTVVDMEKVVTGFRSVAIDENGFRLNGEFMRLNGVCRHQDREDKGNALTSEMHREDFRIIKEVGANAVRLAHYQQAEEVYAICDREGFVVWAEIPYITRSSKTDKLSESAHQQLRELILQNINHPSIAFWGLQNELTLRTKDALLDASVASLQKLAKSLDPYRITTQAQVGGLDPEDSLNCLTDTLGYNLYYGWYYGGYTDLGKWLDDFHQKLPTKTLAISEYGVEGLTHLHTDDPKVRDYTEEYHSLWHELTYELLSERSFIWGTFVWNMFAFGSDFRNEGGCKGRNNKGLVTFDRKTRKDAFYFYKANWSEEPVLHITSKRYQKRPNALITVKVYCNVSPVLLWVNGTSVDLRKRTGVIHEFPVKLKPGVNYVVAKVDKLEDSVTWILDEDQDSNAKVLKSDVDWK